MLLASSQSVRRKSECGRLAAILFVALLFASMSAAQTTSNTQPQTRAYSVSQNNAEIARAKLLEKLGNEAKRARIIADRANDRLIVVAPPDVHALVATTLKSAHQRTPHKAISQSSEPTPLRHLKAEQLLARLQQALAGRVVLWPGDSGEWLGIDIDQQTPSSITIWANKKTEQVRFAGSEEQIQAWRKVVEALDTPAKAPTTTQLVATGDKKKVRQAVELIAQSRPPQQQTLLNKLPAATNDAPGNRPLGEVQIERVAGTDLLIIEGAPEDVRRVRQIIAEIERMAQTSEPEVKLVMLKHVESTALAAILQQVFEQSLSGRGYGSLVAFPLIEPNAIMVVGLPSTVEKAEEILTQLDQPGKALTQFKMFPLKHARAEDALQIVENLFAQNTVTTASGLPTLSPKAHVMADVRTNALIVRAAPRDMDEVGKLIAQIDRVGSDSVNELRIFKLQNSVAEEIEDLLEDVLNANDSDEALARLLRLVTIDDEGRRKLESGMLADVTAYASASSNALVVIAPAESMPLLATLIKQLDQAPNAAVDLKVFPVKNGDAIALKEMLDQLFDTGNEGNQGGGPGASGFSRLRVEVDERTNSLLVAGTRDDLITVDAILRTLDSADARLRENRVYRLKNKSVVDIAPALQDWLRAEREVQGTAPGTASPFQQIEREVVVVEELSSNSLIVSATPRYFDEITRVIQQLDAQDAMVMIQVIIAEIQLGDLDEFGVELGLQDSLLFDRSLLGDLLTTTDTTITNDVGGGSTQFVQEVIQSATITPGFGFGDPNLALGNSGSDASLATASKVGAQALSSFAVNRVNAQRGFGGFVLSASSDSISMLLRALQESRRLEVLNRPQIMTLDNQPGLAFVGQTVPFATSSSPNQFTGQPNVNFERQNVGLSLQVTPRISPDGLIVMAVTARNDRLRPISEGVPIAIAPNGAPINSPIVDSILAETTVSAVSGQTVVLSGLITKTDRALHRRVPLLADIPLLGDLFKFDSTETARSELLIVMTPHIVRNRFDAEMLKQVESARMNWCLSDVVDLHGPVGLRSQADPQGAAEAEAVYPNQLPTPEMLPTPEVQTVPGEVVPAKLTPTIPTPEDPAAKKSWWRLPSLLSKTDDETTSTQ